MVENSDDAERRLRIQRTLQRLAKATAELETLKHPKIIMELAPLTPRLPPRKWNRL